MANTPILGMPQVTPGQNNKETTLNTALAILEQATNAVRTVTVTGNMTVNAEAFQRHFAHIFTGYSSPATITFPALSRCFVVINNCTAALSFKQDAAGTAVSVPAGKRMMVVADGTNLYLLDAPVI